MPTPSVLFVCVQNGGKSPMAAGLMRKTAGERIAVHSAGTRPGTAINSLFAQLLREVDLVVTLGREARVDADGDVAVENWDTDEPSERGIDGIERMRLVRDDIAARVDTLAARLLGATDTP